MACEIENKTLRPNGPFGDVTRKGVCTTHGFRTYGEAIEGSLCPIGQIEDATAKALAQIAGTATAGQSEPTPVADQIVASLETKEHVTKRPRKPKPVEE